jgi:hypothetical protein
MWIANFIGGGVVLVFGLAVRFFKRSGLIAGYNTMSESERAKYDEKEITRFVGNMLIAAAAILLLAGLGALFLPLPEFVIPVSWSLFTAILIGGVIYMNAGGRYKKAE